MDSFVLNLLTAVAVVAGGLALGGWFAWRRHQAGRLQAAQQVSRKQDTDST